MNKARRAVLRSLGAVGATAVRYVDRGGRHARVEFELAGEPIWFPVPRNWPRNPDTEAREFVENNLKKWARRRK